MSTERTRPVDPTRFGAQYTLREGVLAPEGGRRSSDENRKRWAGRLPRRGRTLAAALLLLLGLCGFGPPTLGSGDIFEPRLSASDLAAFRSVPSVPTSVRAVAAVAVDAEDGYSLAARNADARLAPASLTKMMTALVALDHAAPNDIVTATERSRSEPSLIGLDPGDTLTLEEMLYGLLLTSGNDASLAIAESVGGGSIERFVGWMNQRAEAMGLVNTHFANPHGLDQEGHYSSARDMAEIARALMADPRLATIVGTRRYVAQGPPLYLFVTSNPILGAVSGADGVKTGFTDDAGRCFAGSAVRDGRRIVTVVLNSPNIASETSVLIDAGFAQSRPSLLGVPRAGFAAVRDLGPSAGDAARVHAIGWESSFLRAFTRPSGDRGAETVVTLLGRPVSRWVS